MTDIPLPVPSADLVFARFLLTHVSDPTKALQGWAPLVRSGGRMIVQETAALMSNEPTLARYYELVADLQRHHGQDFKVGARLGRLAASSQLRVVRHAMEMIRPPVGASI